MRKSVSERTTTPLAQIDLKNPGAFEPAFEKSRLRKLDPCATLRSAELGRWGEPAKDTPADLGACSNFMKDHQGRDLHVTLYLEASLYDATKHRLAGLPAQIDGTGPTCYARVATHGNGEGTLGAHSGMQVQLESESTDPCSAASDIMSRVVEQLREDEARFASSDQSSLARIDPCGTVDQGAVKAATLGQPAEPQSRDLYSCDWFAPNGVSVSVGFGTGTWRPGPVPNADIGGKPGAVTPGGKRCDVVFEYRPPRSSVGGGELVTASVSMLDPLPMNPCANAIGVARVAKAKLPAQ